MGNTVSAAESIATVIIKPHEKSSLFPENHPKIDNHYSSDKSPPPECPMHKPAVPVVTNECPVKHDNSDINPLNMVSCCKL